MRKLNGKLIVSALIAASMVSASAVSASALSAYPDDERPAIVIPDIIVPVSPSASTTGSDTQGASEATDTSAPDNGEDEIESDKTEVSSNSSGIVDEKATVDLIEDAGEGDTVEIEVAPASNGKITLTEGTIGALKNSGATLVVDVKGEDYTIAISDVTDAQTINIAMDISASTDGASALADLGVDVGSDFSGSAIVIAPAQSGEFGLTLTINLPASATKDLDKKNTRLYYIDDDGVAQDLGKVKFNADGSVAVSITHASAYVLTDAIIPTEADAEDTDDADDFDDADIDDFADDYEDDFDDDFDDFSDDDDSDFGTDDDDDVDDLFIDDYDDSANDVDTADEGKSDTPAIDDSVIVDAGDDSNPGTGVGIALGTLAVTAVSAAAIAVTSKKRK